MRIELIDVTVKYGSIVALANCSLTIDSDDAVAVIGPNGNGKSSLVKAIAGLADFDGKILLDGREPGRRHVRSSWMVKNGVVLVPERRALFPEMSVRDNILTGCYSFTRRLPAKLREEVLVEAVTLFPELRVKLASSAGTLSGGQQQMVAIARGLASRPSILILDEPSLGLAQSVVSKLYEILATLRSQGRGLVIAEESPANALRLCNKVISVERGTATVVSTPAEVEAAR